MKIRRIALSKDTLLKMESVERAFLLLAGHMQNELNSVHKVFAFCLQNRPAESVSSIEGLANGTQAMIYARMLAGKLCEAWQVLDKAFFGTKLSKRIEPKLHPVAQDALEKIKTYFGKTNAIFKVRNAFAFHYSMDEFSTHWEEAANESPFEIVLGGTVGNNLYLASEVVVNLALLKAINPNDRNEALRKFFDEVQSVASGFTAFLEGTILAILEEQSRAGLATLGREEEIFPTCSCNEVALPFFTR